VGDSREGWVDSYTHLLRASSESYYQGKLLVLIDLENIRPSGERLKGFGGIANPLKLTQLYHRCAEILNRAVGRKLNSLECCLLIDEAALTVVAGNIRRFAGIKQGDKNDSNFVGAKDNLWQPDSDGNWRIDPKRDALRMSNHTIVYHQKPTLQECIDAVTKQFYSGEGAIQWAGEAVARSNVDLFETKKDKLSFLKAYEQGKAKDWILERFPNIPDIELEHRLQRYGLNPCAEVSMSNNFCDLSEIHLNMIDPNNLKEQQEAFTAGAINVVGLLHQKFIDSRYQLSRELDPIIGVSFTGLFDFFVKAFGIEWLNWWMTGRKEKWMSDNHETVLIELLSLSISDISNPPEQEEINSTGKLFKYYEKQYLTFWKSIVEEKVIEYCERHKIRKPNRFTVVQPAGTKSLLTNASPGWHPPFGINYIRRITYRKNDAVAKACLDYGYSVIPGQSDKDDKGTLLNNPFDERVTEWLVEIPVSVSWSNLEGIENIDINKISATSMFDFYMGVQEHWTTHNTSSTILLKEDEIIPLATKIFEAIQEDKGYISSALLARFDAPFPRLPFENISKDKYNKMKSEVEQRRNNKKTFQELVNYYIENTETIPDSACEGMSCILK
ncbi:MAG: ribonucleoside-triphosphate reductase, adenosylcobalamin-dependent, partial [Okeania sp. SIO4D6]|nr:ribonucleoside-triphosphate reductase, adenosylcobalamin-dependent [Okeania sp. SIO4D6]